jgi:hypothetical protein
MAEDHEPSFRARLGGRIYQESIDDLASLEEMLIYGQVDQALEKMDELCLDSLKEMLIYGQVDQALENVRTRRQHVSECKAGSERESDVLSALEAERDELSAERDELSETHKEGKEELEKKIKDSEARLAKVEALQDQVDQALNKGDLAKARALWSDLEEYEEYLKDQG